tara:strand:- start:104 stop:973 length:870 start_codon:yes stop_codon:yes gene_type:complete
MSVIKERYWLSGLFTVLGLVALVALIFFMGNKQNSDHSLSYKVTFNESVGGLSKGSLVKFKGINIGHVDYLRIDQKNNDQVLVSVKIAKDFQVKTNMFATATLSGIAGESFIQLNNQADDSNPEVLKEGQTIPSKPSTLQKISDQAPKVVEAVEKLMQKISDFFTPQMHKNVKELMQSLTQLANDASKAGGRLEGTIKNADSLFKTFKDTATQITTTFQKIETTTDSFNHFIGSNQDDIKRFTKHGLDQFVTLALSASTAFEKLERFIDTLDHKVINFSVNEKPSSYRI